MLGDLGLEVTSSDVVAVVGYAIDAVVATEPPEGTSVFPGDPVNLVVGRRPQATSVERDPPLAWGTWETTDVVELSVGRCSIGRSDGGVLVFDRADCAGPHDFQYFGTVNVPGPLASWEDAAPALRDACNAEFAAFVGAPITGSDLAIYLVVSTDSGASGGEGYCMLGHIRDGLQVVGDAAGTLW